MKRHGTHEGLRMFITLRLLQFNPVRSVLSRPLDDTLHTLTVLYLGRKELVESCHEDC